QDLVGPDHAEQAPVVAAEPHDERVEDARRVVLVHSSPFGWVRGSPSGRGSPAAGCRPWARAAASRMRAARSGSGSGRGRVPRVKGGVSAERTTSRAAAWKAP